MDDSALQVYKDGDYGPYLDLESSLSEQQEELEGFLDKYENRSLFITARLSKCYIITERVLNAARFNNKRETPGATRASACITNKYASVFFFRLSELGLAPGPLFRKCGPTVENAWRVFLGGLLNRFPWVMGNGKFRNWADVGSRSSFMGK